MYIYTEHLTWKQPPESNSAHTVCQSALWGSNILLYTHYWLKGDFKAALVDILPHGGSADMLMEQSVLKSSVH